MTEPLMMKQIIDVPTGKIEVGNEKMILKTSAIGSCVVISVSSVKKKVGALAHIMLPGKAPDSNSFEKTKYAADAIDEILKKIVSFGVDIKDIEVCLVGGANILKRTDDATGKNNIDSTIEILRERKIMIKAQAVGGTARRSVSFDIEKGCIFYTEGDEDKGLLWQREAERRPYTVKNRPQEDRAVAVGK